MNPLQKQINQQYEQGKLLNKIKQGLNQNQKKLDTAGIGDLAAVDEFHIRGREATAELAEQLDIQAGNKVLDVGCGLGGACRYLSKKYKAITTGIDITEEYCRVAEDLTKATGLQEKVSFLQADACSLPFEDAHFDAVITLHTQMNIERKNMFYEEIMRVLKPGGRFGFYDIFSGRHGELQFPVPWADTPSVSWLSDPGSIRQMLDSMNFREVGWHDDTKAALNWFKSMFEKAKESGPPPVGLHLLMGSNAPEKMKNMIENLEKGSLCIVRATFQK